jgi:hypothetical protein
MGHSMHPPHTIIKPIYGNMEMVSKHGDQVIVGTTRMNMLNFFAIETWIDSQPGK